MFEHVRKHNKILMVVLFLLIIPSFVLVGVDGYNRMIEKDRTVARVGKVEITNGEWEAAHREEVERVRQLMPTIDARLLDSESVRYATLERLVRERVLQQAAQDARLGASDARLARELQSIPAIAQLRRADGSLDMERYRDLLGRQGMSPEMFEARMRADLAARQVQAGARGNAEARILTTVFAAELVSIAGIYRTFEDGVPAKLANQPVQVRLAQEPAVSASTGLKSRLEIDILRVD